VIDEAGYIPFVPEARRGQHAAHRPLAGLRQETAGQAEERAE
jgi:hypothetical protein